MTEAEKKARKAMIDSLFFDTKTCILGKSSQEMKDKAKKVYEDELNKAKSQEKT